MAATQRKWIGLSLFCLAFLCFSPGFLLGLGTEEDLSQLSDLQIIEELLQNLNRREEILQLRESNLQKRENLLTTTENLLLKSVDSLTETSSYLQSLDAGYRREIAIRNGIIAGLTALLVWSLVR